MNKEGWHDPEFAGVPAGKAAVAARASAWERYFVGPVPSVVFGIVGPIVCYAVKPAILGRNVSYIPGLRFIDIYWIFGYGVIGLEVATLALWLRRGERLGRGTGVVAGMLAAGGLFAGGLGLVMLPASAIGLMIVIGALGFVPFFTSIVFLRSAGRAYQQARTAIGAPKARVALLAGMALALGVPGGLQVWVTSRARSAVRDFAAGVPSAPGRLRAWSAFIDRDGLVRAYIVEQDPTRKARLAQAYKGLTGEDVERSRIFLSE